MTPEQRAVAQPVHHWHVWEAYTGGWRCTLCGETQPVERRPR